MADLALQAIESHGGTAASLLSKLPGRRIDAHIREVAAAGLPEQSEQEGGYNYAYAHLSHLPLFALYSVKGEAKTQREWDRHMPAGSENFGQGPKMSVKDQVGMAYVNHITGAPSIMTAGMWTGRTIAALHTVAAKALGEQFVLARFTRWTMPAAAAADLGEKVSWFVDVFECHCDPSLKRAAAWKLAGNSIAIKAGLPGDEKVTVKVLEFGAKTFKGQKGWSTKHKVKALCEALVLVKDGIELQMEIVARTQRMCNSVVSTELVKEYDKQWHVPVLQT